MLLIAILACPLLAAALAAPGMLERGRAETAGVILSGLGFLLATLVAGRVVARGVVSIGPEEFLRADGLAAVLLLVVTGVAWVSLWFGERGEQHGRRYLFLSQMFLFTMLLAVTINNVGVMWVAVESTTIATAF